jgi:hypothetical protein
VRGERAPGRADGENDMLDVWRAGLHRRDGDAQEPRFCPLEGFLRLSDSPSLQRLPRRFEQRD